MTILYLPHGGGPLPLLGDPKHRELTRFMQNLPASLPRPEAIIVVSAHWEADPLRISSAPAPEMLYDYYGFPAESYEFQYPAPGNPQLAQQLASHLRGLGLKVELDGARGYDHGTFVPLILLYPAADIPVLQLSLHPSLDAQFHINLGKALAPLLGDQYLLLGSGMSFHNMRAFFSADPSIWPRSQVFDSWLNQTLTAAELSPAQREVQLANWLQAPEARFCHPREEHLLPLMVCAGAAWAKGLSAQRNYNHQLLGTQVSGFIWH